jgi:hypothetical protein
MVAEFDLRRLDDRAGALLRANALAGYAGSGDSPWVR